jgi:hypothetical protein
MAGALLVLRGDLTLLACDALLVPTSHAVEVTRSWRGVVGPSSPGNADWWRVDVVPPASWGEQQRCFLAPEPSLGRDVWFVLTGRHGATITWLVAGVAAALSQAARQIDRTKSKRSKPLVGLPLVGTGAGGYGDDRGAVIAALLPALDRIAAEEDIDIALVLWDEADHAAVQKTRHPQPHPHIDPDGVAEELGRLAAQNQLAVFLGAGVSLAAGLPSWKELITELADISHIGPSLLDLPPLDGAQVAFDKMRGDFLTYMQRTFTPQTHAVAHALLASLECEAALTTNYDNCYEQAMAGRRQELRVLPRERAEPGVPWLLKLHGDAAHPETIVLTRKQYLDHSEWSAPLTGLVQAQLLTRHVLFVGFSLVDDTFARLAHQVLRLVGSHGKEPSPLATVLQLTTDPARAELYKEGLRHIPVAKDATDLSVAARDLELFLDRMAWAACLARSGAKRYLLDPRYAGMVTPAAEHALRDRLLELLTNVTTEERATSAWSVVEKALIELGAGSPGE